MFPVPGKYPGLCLWIENVYTFGVNAKAFSTPSPEMHRHIWSSYNAHVRLFKIPPHLSAAAMNLILLTMVYIQIDI